MVSFSLRRGLLLRRLPLGAFMAAAHCQHPVQQTLSWQRLNQGLPIGGKLLRYVIQILEQKSSMMTATCRPCWPLCKLRHTELRKHSCHAVKLTAGQKCQMQSWSCSWPQENLPRLLTIVQALADNGKSTCRCLCAPVPSRLACKAAAGAPAASCGCTSASCCPSELALSGYSVPSRKSTVAVGTVRGEEVPCRQMASHHETGRRRRAAGCTSSCLHSALTVPHAGRPAVS